MARGGRTSLALLFLEIACLTRYCPPWAWVETEAVVPISVVDLVHERNGRMAILHFLDQQTMSL